MVEAFLQRAGILLVSLFVLALPAAVVAQFEAKVGDSLNIQINRADNQLVIAFNGQEVYNKTTENDPELNDNVDLTGRFRQGINMLEMAGINTGHGAHFKVRVLHNGLDVQQFDVRPPGNGVVWKTRLDFTVP